MNTRAEVYHAIDTERDYQDGKWINNTPDGNRKHSAEDWILYMEDYLAEAKHVLARNSDANAYPPVMDIMRKVTALGVVAMEQLGVVERIVV